MDDEFEGTEPTGTEVSETSGPVETEAAPAVNPGGYNPAWEPLRTKLGETTFHLVKDELKQFDQAAEKRISGLNTQLKAYSALGAPDQLQRYATLAQRIDAEPEAIYEALGQFLQQNGRMPQTKQEVQQVQDEIDDASAPDDPTARQLEELKATQQQIQQYLQQQVEQQMRQQADQEIQTEIEQLRGKFKQFDDADLKEVVQRAAFLAQTSGVVPPLEQVAQDYLDNTVNRIRSIPRSNDTAPRLVPTSGGGLPGSTSTQSLGKRSNKEIQDLVAGFITQNRR